jgi:hypothetical protein
MGKKYMSFSLNYSCKGTLLPAITLAKHIILELNVEDVQMVYIVHPIFTDKPFNSTIRFYKILPKYFR